MFTDDFPLPAPPIPAANTDFILYDPDDPSDVVPNNVVWKGLVADLFFDQNVSLFVEVPQINGTYRTMNGSGQTVLANDPTQVLVAFNGLKTRVRLRTGGTPPTSATAVIAARLTLERL